MMKERATRESILQIFRQHRADPREAFNESHFLDFLLANPKKKGVIRNSFNGLRRFNAFIEKVQYKYGVCFSLEDLESNYSLEQFIERTNKLQQSRHGSLKSLKSQERAGAGVQVIVLLDAVLLGLAYTLSDFIWISGVLLVISVLATVAFAVFAYRRRLYLRRLRSRIKGGAG